MFGAIAQAFVCTLIMMARCTQGAAGGSKLMRRDLDGVETDNDHATPSHNIPRQLVFTAKEHTMENLPLPVQRNINKTVERNPGLVVKWFGDADCIEHLQKHFDMELVAYYRMESHGSHRGDLCRAAVLATEGGYYVDLDVELNEPLTDLVDSDTTFMSVVEVDRIHLLNAVMAASVGNDVLREQVRQIRYAYRIGAVALDMNIGTTTLHKALVKVTGEQCPGQTRPSGPFSRWGCGKHILRLYEETWLDCNKNYGKGDGGGSCPPERHDAQKEFQGTFFALSDEGRHVIGWSRFAACRTWGCEAGGMSETKV